MTQHTQSVPHDEPVPLTSYAESLLDGITGPMTTVTTAILGDASIPARIAREITNLIIRGDFPPGMRLGEAKLAEMFRTSRTPVREAVRRLEQSGLVVVVPRIGAHVATITAKTVRDSYVCRAYLHGLAVRLVTDAGRGDDLAILDNLMRQMAEAARRESADEFFRLHVAFHDTTVAMTRNAVLSSMVGQLGLTTLRLRYLSLTVPGRMSTSAQAHRALMTSMHRGDAEEAEAITRDVILGARDALLGAYFGAAIPSGAAESGPPQSQQDRQ